MITGDVQTQLPISGAAASAALFAAPQPASPWTPTLTFATPGDLAVTYTSRVGSYVKIGRLVVAWYNVLTATFTFTTATGNLLITGLPFVSSAGTALGYGPLEIAGLTKVTYTNFTARVGVSGSQIQFLASGSAVALSGIVAADTPTVGPVTLRGVVAYETDS